MTRSTSLDTVKTVVDSTKKSHVRVKVISVTNLHHRMDGKGRRGKKFIVLEVKIKYEKDAYSSAPSIVTSIVVYWSTSPRLRLDLMMSSLDWKPLYCVVVNKGRR